MDKSIKKCPMCAETIPVEAAACEYCGARFAVTATGYCTNCHAMRVADAGGRCKVCGTEVADRRVESKFIEETAVPPAISPPAASPATAAAEPVSATAGLPETPVARRGKSWIWIPAGCLGALLLCLVAGGVLWTQRDNLPVVSGLLATPTRTPVPKPAMEVWVYCGEFGDSPVYVESDQPIIFYWTWGTTSDEYQQDYIDAASFALRLDGRNQDISTATQSRYICEDVYLCVKWQLPQLVLELGTHRAEMTVSLSREITDGFDLDGNPGLDMYGPGDRTFLPCEIIVQ